MPSHGSHVLTLQAACIAAVKFLAHLVNQQVLHELVALELLTLLLDDPSDDSVEIAVGFIKVRKPLLVVGGDGYLVSCRSVE